MGNVRKKLRLSFLFLVLICLNGYGQRPSGNINIRDVKWKKISDSDFDIIYEPTQYVYKYKQDYIQLRLSNNDYVIYSLIDNRYYVIKDFDDAPNQSIMETEFCTTSNAVYIRYNNNTFNIIDRGKVVNGLYFEGYSSSGDYVYTSTENGKSYFIKKSYYNNIGYDSPKGISSQ